MGRSTGLTLAMLVAVSGCANSNPMPASPGSATRPQTTTPARLPPSSRPRLVTVDPSTSGKGSSGRKPGVPYLMNGTITDPRGATLRVPADTIDFAPYPGGSWAYTSPSAGSVDWIHLPGHAPPRVSQVGSYAVTPDSASLAYPLRRHGMSKLVLVGAHARMWPVAATARNVAGILPGGDIVYNDRASIKIAHQDGTVTTLDYRYALAVSAATGVIAAETGAVTSGGDACWRLVSSTGAALSGQLCGPDQPMFNADGTRIAATSHPPTGVLGVSGDTGVEIFDARNLEPIAAFQAPAGGHFDGLSWDGDAVLTSVWSRGRWTLVWLSHHGASKVGAGQRSGFADHSPWNFGTGPLNAVHKPDAAGQRGAAVRICPSQGVRVAASRAPRERTSKSSPGKFDCRRWVACLA